MYVHIYTHNITVLHTAELLNKQHHVHSLAFLEDEMNCVFLPDCL